MNENWILLSPEPADGGGTGGEGNEGAEGAQGTETDILEGAEAGGSGEEGGEEASVGSGLSKDDITEILKGAMGEMQPKKEEAAALQKELTPEQLEQMFNVWKPSNDLLAQLKSDDANVAIKAWHAIRDGMMKQAMTMVEHRVQQLLKTQKGEFDSQFAPLNEYVTQAQATSFRNEFFEKNPDLEPYEELVDAVAAKLQSSGFKGKTREEVMTKFASESKEVIKKLLAKGGAAGAGQPTAQNQNGKGAGAPARKMSNLTGGSAPGAGKGGAGREAKGPPGLEVFD